MQLRDINNIFSISNIGVFPNPVNSELNFNFGENNNEVELSIYDISGRVVGSFKFSHSGKTTHKEIIDVSAYNNGIYFCKFTIVGNQATRKFIKN